MYSLVFVWFFIFSPVQSSAPLSAPGFSVTQIYASASLGVICHPRRHLATVYTAMIAISII